ncbi:MAG: SDR family NAD(P)-dependent oxidoreductase [Staphylococcus sp.]|nr:SDR family NAD(P)-dependent oxidoreductase [Staphylococcus sp.]
MNILIIGATSGIGHELWRHYAATGNNVAVMGRRRAILDEMIREYPGNTCIGQCDISDIPSFEAALKSVLAKFDTLDAAIVCAGIGELNPDLESTTELSTIAVNVTGWTNAVCSIYKIFERQKSGHLVTITSVGGMQPTMVAPSYSASKAFQINYTKSLQQKSKNTSIVVTEIRPGLVDTRMAKGDGLFWVMPLDKVVRQIVSAISKNKKLKIVTTRWRMLNWILKHFM